MLHPMLDARMFRYGHDRMLQIAAQRRLVRAAQAARRTPAPLPAATGTAADGGPERAGGRFVQCPRAGAPALPALALSHGPPRAVAVSLRRQDETRGRRGRARH
jgi:hypothetical protein